MSISHQKFPLDTLLISLSLVNVCLPRNSYCGSVLYDNSVVQCQVNPSVLLQTPHPTLLDRIYKKLDIVTMITTTSVTPPPKRTPASGQVSVAHCSHPSDVSIDLPVRVRVRGVWHGVDPEKFTERFPTVRRIVHKQSVRKTQKETCDENKWQSRGDTPLGASEPLRRGSGQPALPPSGTRGSLLSQ